MMKDIELKNDTNAVFSFNTHGSNFKYMLLNGNIYISHVLSYAFSVEIPEEINGAVVTGILTGAIHDLGCSAITLPKTLKYIGSHAIYDCSEIKTLSIPKNVEYIEERAIVHCPKLECVHMECKHINKLPKFMIDDCGNLKSLYFYANADNIDKEFVRDEHRSFKIFCNPKNSIIKQLNDSDFKIEPCYTSSIERFLDEDCQPENLDKG